MKIPLYKLFLVVAVYAVALAVFSSYGSVAIFLAVCLSTALSAAVILIRRDNILDVCLVGFCSVCFGLFGSLCCSQLILHVVFGHGGDIDDVGTSVATGAAIGALTGGVIGSSLLKGKHRR